MGKAKKVLKKGSKKEVEPQQIDEAEDQQSAEQPELAQPEFEAVESAADQPDSQSAKQSAVDRLRALIERAGKKHWFALLVIVGAGIAYAIPTSRYEILNFLSEADASVTVLNADTGQPIEGVKATLVSAGTVTTDENGVAHFNDAEYGKASLVLGKEAYETVTTVVNITKDDIDLGEFKLKPLGVPVKVTATNWLNKKPIQDFTVANAAGDLTFKSENGVAILNIPSDATGELTFTVTSEGYNVGELKVDADEVKPGSKEEYEVSTSLVLGGSHFFISDRDATIGFYSSNYDGSSVKRLIDTKQKGDYLNYLPIPNTENTYAVILSSKNNSYQDQLAIADLNAGKLEIVDDAIGQDVSFNFETVDEKRILYHVRYDEDRKDQMKLKSYEFSSKKLVTVFSSSEYYNAKYAPDQNQVYIGESVSERNSYTFLKVSLPGGEREIIMANRDVYGLQIPSAHPDKLIFYSIRLASGDTDPSGWYIMDLNDNKSIQNRGDKFPDLGDEDEVEIPDSEKGLASPDKKNRIWIDTRDGRGRLILNDSSKTVGGQPEELSVVSIIRWVNDTQLTVTARHNDQASDYIVDIETGDFKKITNTFSQSYRGYGHGH